jgi:hypothetical protein
MSAPQQPDYVGSRSFISIEFGEEHTYNGVVPFYSTR